MRLRRADCGHWIPEDLAPAGIHADTEQQPVYLCAQCEQLARSHLKPKIETKTVAIETKNVGAGGGVPFETLYAESPYLKGRRAAGDGIPEEDVPYADRRTKDAKEWLRGHREAKGVIESGAAAGDPGRGREAPA